MSLTSRVEGVDFRSGLEIGALLFLRTILISKIIEILIITVLIIAANIDDVLMIGISADDLLI